MRNELPSPSRRRGRPPAFERETVLKRAARTFWNLGYEGASIAELTQAMGITPQSLYAAFSSKADLYREALGWYRRNAGASAAQALEEGDVVAALASLLRGSAAEFTRRDYPAGCMISTAVLACATENEPLARHAADLRDGTLAAIRSRIERGVADGQLRPDTDAEALARFVGAMIQGMSVQARDGASQQALGAVVSHAVAEIERWRLNETFHKRGG